MKREQEQMTVDGHEIMSIIKEGERQGFEVPEIQIALTHSIQDKQRPLIWLQTKWSDLIDTVATMATQEGASADQNDVGDISTQEAKHALIHCEGDIEKAAKMCVQERKAKFAEINSSNQYAREDILTALYQNHGVTEEAFDQLNHSVLQSYADRLWETNENAGGDVAIAAAARSASAELINSVSNSVITHANFTRLVSDITIDKERRVRMVFVEGKLRSWGRAEMVVTILDKEVTESENPLECTLEDIIEAVRNCGDRKSSLVYLKQTCGICYSNFPMTKIRDLDVCNCKLCQSCVKGYFEVAIREKYVRNWCCPLCDAPGLEDEARASSYFEFLSLILQSMVSREVLDLYEIKLRDWHLQKDPNFRWCAHCASGFIWDRPDVLGMTCPSCKKKTCFMCKIKWEEQHDGLSCEEYEQWKIDNDPEKQAKGVKLYLEENGIDCPSCKMRYSLAKGGCMHFKCPQCGYEFCSGCSQAFLHQGACKLLKSCKGKGLHCHHPRDCFYFLRDEDIPDLQKLLKDNKCRFNTEVPPTQEDPEHCPVMEQKEYGPQKKDEPCGKDAKRGLAGLCEDHYKEYLVSLINKHKIDPLAMMTLQQMKILIERNEKELPKRNQNEADNAYRRKVVQFIKERWQLHR
ncbi:E3 ubiquitin-protein ligase RNF31-like [Ruditapes philippinarum]|uniref:E3 ubiquitin-protein ligase RNF31-like n=1 Tax=Ruditapes philippinarum TaxID=129788 RepID=UPI00295B775A|nr:E3 ubiquitin-protein ligase RNF31-like [Ruditapes philippinarum]